MGSSNPLKDRLQGSKGLWVICPNIVTSDATGVYAFTVPFDCKITSYSVFADSPGADSVFGTAGAGAFDLQYHASTYASTATMLTALITGPNDPVGDITAGTEYAGVIDTTAATALNIVAKGGLLKIVCDWTSGTSPHLTHVIGYETTAES